MPEAPQKPIFLVWAIGNRGVLALMTVCTSRLIAETYRDGAKESPHIARAWIEE